MENICIGRRYNFKKGFEQCLNSEKCEAYKNYLADEEWYDKIRIDHNFKSMKEFRKCKHYDSA